MDAAVDFDFVAGGGPHARGRRLDGSNVRFHGRRRVAVVLALMLSGLLVISAAPSPADATTWTGADAQAHAKRTLRQGDRGAAVERLQRRLRELRYWVGPVDGRFGHSTAQAVMAFQKVNGLQPDVVVGAATWSALKTPVTVRPRSRRGRVIEVDRSRQVLLRVIRGKVRRIFNTSTGAPGMTTPAGRFRVDRHIDGWRHAPLGRLYRPKYFNEGIAIHGATEIPAYPASHGCARVSLAAMDWLFPRTPIGTRVWVY